MIVSHKIRYLFIEIPLTGSWAIRHELCDLYDGESILHKHATYPEFRREVGAAANDYFVFATVRNPFDEVVSRYFKLKTDHKGVFSEEAHADALVSDYSDLKKYEFIHRTDASFEDFFRKYHNRTFGGMIDLTSKRYDYVIRYENLQEGFSEVLQTLGIKQKRPVPVSNKTKGRDVNWTTYYTPEVEEQAAKVFGPFCRKWGYDLPFGSGQAQDNPVDLLRFRAMNMMRSIYVSHFRYNDKGFARLARRLRAMMLD